MNGLKKLLPDVAAIVLFVVLSFAYFYPAVFEGRILAQHDAVAGIGAGREHQEYHQEHGKVTRWTNSLFSGMPTYQLAPGYDSSRTLNTVQDLYHLYLPTYVWYVFVMLLGFYILLRAFNFKVWMAALGAIIWAFSSYFFIIIAAGHIWKFALRWHTSRLPLQAWYWLIVENIGLAESLRHFSPRFRLCRTTSK